MPLATFDCVVVKPSFEIAFFYMNVAEQGASIARIDIPMWVARDKRAVNARRAGTRIETDENEGRKIRLMICASGIPTFAQISFE